MGRRQEFAVWGRRHEFAVWGRRQEFAVWGGRQEFAVWVDAHASRLSNIDDDAVEKG
jgi:hypothetical protein